MPVIKGGDLMVFLGGTSIAFATNHTLSISGETKETTSKDSGGKWATSELNLLSWTANSENLYADSGAGKTYDDLFDLMIKREPVELIFGPEGNSTTDKLDEVPTGGWTPKANSGYKGNALITSLEKNAQNGENATFTVEFTGVGALTKVTSSTSSTTTSK
jgi:hypothetical protein